MLVDIQHEVISDIDTRMVLPLAQPEFFKQTHMTVLTPVVNYNGEQLVLVTPQIAAVSKKLFRKPIGTLEHFRDEVIAALDLAISGRWQGVLRCAGGNGLSTTSRSRRARSYCCCF